MRISEVCNLGLVLFKKSQILQLILKDSSLTLIWYPDGIYWRLDGIHGKVPFSNMTSISVSKWEILDQDENLYDQELKPEKTSFFVGSQEMSYKNIRLKFKLL